MPTRTWRVDHAEFPGDSIDRDRGYPDLELELHPVGILTERPSFQLLIKIKNSVTILNYQATRELMAWLDEKVMDETHHS